MSQVYCYQQSICDSIIVILSAAKDLWHADAYATFSMTSNYMGAHDIKVDLLHPSTLLCRLLLLEICICYKCVIYL